MDEKNKNTEQGKEKDLEKKPVKEVKWFKKIRGFKRFLLFTGLYLGVFFILFAVSAEYTSRPSFCPTCHYMETFYQSWRTSEHNKVDCVECHFEPGISGTIKGKVNGLVQIVNYISLTYKKRKPWAEIPNNTCARSGCHETQELQDSTYNFKGVEFSHKNHLKELKRGKTLKCTSCHSQIVQGTHMEVTESTCFNCHFMKSDDPEHKFDKLSDCKTCHDLKGFSKEQMAGLRYDHTKVVENDVSCIGCHTNTVAGNGDVGKERCFQCHFENDRLDKYSDTKFMHEVHISKHSMKCFVCHSPIEHKVQKIDPNTPPDCQGCHTNAHIQQVNLFTGQNAFETENLPSVMFMNGINCRGCHVFHEKERLGIETLKSGESSCEQCHGTGYDKLTKQWEQASIKRLSIINSIYNSVNSVVSGTKSNNKAEAEKYLAEAKHNIDIVEIGKSVHNVQFADKVLIGSYALMKKALSVIGSSKVLPEFKSSSDFIPNECISCHSGIEEISVNKFGMKFSHNQHVVKSRVACAKCHSNAKKHGELVVNKDNCNSCHHSRVNSDDDCAKCHNFQNLIYSGNYMGKSQPDIMKAEGVGCIDCHSDAVEIIKPDINICLKCHDDGYDEMGVEWKVDVNKLEKELEAELQRVKGLSPDSEMTEQINESKKLLSDISSRPSIYAHNYDLISTLLSEKIKALKKLE
ncbi:MAG: NapC/NirT family cytochrome c [Ignavibacteria bacterium]